MIVKITLTEPLGSSLGPNFNLTSNVGSVSPSTATRTELLAGKDVTVDDTATIVTVTSTGACPNSVNINITGLPVTTQPPTTEVTEFSRSLGYPINQEACQFGVNNYEELNYFRKGLPSSPIEEGPQVYDIIYVDPEGNFTWNGQDGWYVVGFQSLIPYAIRVNEDGIVTETFNC